MNEIYIRYKSMELFPTVTTHADYFCFISYEYPTVKKGQLWNFLKTRPILTDSLNPF